MVRTKVKWSVGFCYLVIFSNFISSLPIVQYNNVVTESKLELKNALTHEKQLPDNAYYDKIDMETEQSASDTLPSATNDIHRSATRLQRNNLVRPGFTIFQYAVELTIDGDNFDGRLVLRCTVTLATRDDPLIMHAEGLNIRSVAADVSNADNVVPADFDTYDGLLEIRPARPSLNHVIIIEYSGNLRNGGQGLYLGQDNYIGMNLYPTNARRVFPCIDEATQSTDITLTINGVTYGNLISNTQHVENDPTSFQSLMGAPLRWAMIGHDFTTYNVPTPNVLLSGRPGLSGQENQASIAINAIFNYLNEWTDKPYLETVLNQANSMNVIALPDVDIEWNSLSIVGLWEPYIFMENQQFSVKQRQVALIKIAEALARPWFGFTIIPQNWIYQWLISGLQTYVAFEAVKEFESGTDEIIDFDTIFVTEILQESLFRDGYLSATILEPEELLTDEVDIRNHINNGLLKYKAPVILRMLRLALDEENDFVQYGAQRLLLSRSSFNLDTVNTFNFNEIIEAIWDGDQFDDIEGFLQPYIQTRGCPLLTVNYQSNLVTISRSTFNYAGEATGSNFFIPISFTTSVNPDFDNIFPSRIYHEPTSIDFRVNLDDDDWILFNIQGQGYYRVQYNIDMWERIIAALEDPERREVIHPLNRATLLDDSLNLARRLFSGLNYDFALRIVLTMEHEKEYAVWKAFVRNMNFIRKRLEAMVAEDEDLDPDIYLVKAEKITKENTMSWTYNEWMNSESELILVVNSDTVAKILMVRRTIHTVEGELDFRPEVNVVEPPMDTLTRAMVMDHACRAGYDSCIAAAIDWFYGSNDEVNPNIPRDLRPAVYCAVIKEGDENAREMLIELLEDVQTRTVYDRVVILESLACSPDEGFIRGFLADTVAGDSPYSTAEKIRIFKAVAESSYNNARIALAFIRDNTNNIRDHFGGSASLEECIFALADNVVNGDMAGDFRLWIESNTNTLFDSEQAAQLALQVVNENIDWSNQHLQDVYDWIDENNSTTAAVSMILLLITAALTLFN